MVMKTYRQIFPSSFPPFPAFRLEFFCVRTPNILSMMHNMNTVFDSSALWNKDRRVPIFASATRKRSVFVGIAHVDRNNGEET